MSKHTIIAHFDVDFPGTDPEETETAHVEVEISYSMTGGCPEQGPSYASGGQPEEHPEIEMLSAKLIDGDGISLTDDQLTERAQHWLDNDGFDAAIQNGNEPYDGDY